MIRCLHLLMVFAMAQLSAGVFYYGKIEAGATGKLESTDRLYSSDGNTKLNMQSDGNLVLYYDVSALWSTGTGGNSGAAFWLNVLSNGKLCIYPDGSTTSKWCTASGGHSSEAPLYLAIGDRCICMMGENGIFWSKGDNDCDTYKPYDIAFLNIFDVSSNYSPIRWTNQEQYVCTSTLLDDYTYSGTSYDQCAAACYKNDLCTHFMLQWSSASEFDLCRLVHLCDRRTSDSNYWEIYELNRNDSVNFIESASQFSVLWSTKRAFKLWYGSSKVKLTNADESLTVWSKTADRLWLQNQGRIAFQSCDDSSCSSYTASSQLCSPDLSKGPYTLYVMDYGQLVIKNSNGAITCVIGYDDEAALEVPYDEEAYIASCSGIDAVSSNSASSADYARYGLLATAKATAVFGAVSVSTASFFAALSISIFQSTDSTSGDNTGIMQCIEDYVNYRINTLLEISENFAIADFQTKMDILIDNIHSSSTAEGHLSEWDNNAAHELVIAETPKTITTYGRSALPIVANLMNLRLYHWAQIMNLLDCTDSDCVIDYIHETEDVLESGKKRMGNFRSHNGQLIEAYLDGIAEVWHNIMEDTTISTQQKTEEIQAIWMDGAVCSLWIPRTYVMSQRCTTATCTYDSTMNVPHYNWINDSYVFNSQNLSAYSYSSSTYDLTSGSMGDDCKNIVYKWIAAQYTSSNNHELSWNGKTELGGHNRNHYRVDASCQNPGSSNDCTSRCLTEAIGSNERCISCSTIGTNEYVSKLSVLPFVPDLVSGSWTKKNHIADEILDSLPLMQTITYAQCRDTETFSPTIIGPDNNDLQFFGTNNKYDCWQRNNPISSQTQVSGQCATSDEVAVGISFYRAIEWPGSGSEAGYFLWKMRLQCMRVSYDEERTYDIDLWSTSSLAGSHYSDSGGGGGAAGTYEYEGWTPFKTCPPGYAINKICADYGWFSTTSDYRKKSKINYGINVNCKKLVYSSSPAKQVMHEYDDNHRNDLSDLFEDENGDYDYNNHDIYWMQNMMENASVSIVTSVLITLCCIGSLYGIFHCANRNQSKKYELVESGCGDDTQSA